MDYEILFYQMFTILITFSNLLSCRTEFATLFSCFRTVSIKQGLETRQGMRLFSLPDFKGFGQSLKIDFDLF